MRGKNDHLFFAAGLAMLLAAPPILAQKEVTPTEPVVPAQPESPYETLVHGHKPSPAWTQDRNFSTTRLWLLDPGSIEVATWWNTRIYEKGPNSLRFKEEIEIGVVPHLQLDLYANFRYDPVDGLTKPGKEINSADPAAASSGEQPDESRYIQWYGYSIEARIAIPSTYGQIPTNPVIYLEWISQPDAPGRVEARLLLGGAATKWLFLAANPYVEFNVEPTSSDVTDDEGITTTRKTWLYDAEAGSTLAAGFGITDRFRLSLEAKVGVDMLGDEKNAWHFVTWLGPGFILKPFNNKYLKVIGTFLINLPVTDEDEGHDDPQRYEPVLIIASEF
jgi:hypothetical protein